MCKNTIIPLNLIVYACAEGKTSILSHSDS